MLALKYAGVARSVASPRARPAVLVRDDGPAAIFDPAVFRFGTVEPDEFPECVSVLMDGFYKDILTLAKDDFSEEEMEAMRPVLSIFNNYFSRFTRAVLQVEGQQRLAVRMPIGGLARGNSRDGAMMLCVQHRDSGAIVAVGELSEQPRDGKVPGDIRFPSLPWQQRPARVAYICNLAVRKDWRGQGHGTALLRGLEDVARTTWGFDEVYLHAATAKERLLRMYAGRGYEAMPSFDQPDWILAVAGREATRYHRKPL